VVRLTLLCSWYTILSHNVPKPLAVRDRYMDWYALTVFVGAMPSVGESHVDETGPEQLQGGLSTWVGSRGTARRTLMGRHTLGGARHTSSPVPCEPSCLFPSILAPLCP
jgi:hypothetical protein